jgi:hypothetical protein
MLIRYKNNGVEKHVTNEVGRGFVDAGLAVEVLPEIDRRHPNTNWKVIDGAIVGDYQYPPAIGYRCATCGSGAVSDGPTVHKTVQFRHCGIVEPVPQDVANEYVRRREAYFKRGKQRAPRNAGNSDDLYLSQQQAYAVSLGLPPRGADGKVIKGHKIFS